MGYYVRVVIISFILVSANSFSNEYYDIDINEILNFDISSIPAWESGALIPYKHTEGDPHTDRVSNFLCYTDSTCPSKYGGYGGPNLGKTPINISFLEQKSGVRRLLTMYGYRTTACSYNAQRLERGSGCGGSRGRLYLNIPTEEFSKLNFGGLWIMDELKIRTCEGASCPYDGLALTTVNIKVNLTDRNNAQIYIPSSGFSTANVNIKLYERFDGQLKGEESLGICVYDGYGSNSRSMSLTFTGPVNSDDSFVLRIKEPRREDGEIPITIKLAYPGNLPLTVRAGESYSYFLNGHDSVVMGLPGISTPVMCIPVDVILSIEPFVKNEKLAGVYNGTFTLSFDANLY
ncbi:TPA: CfaE/CblD family pilus tip adhesin [Vibrio parahaemolyticus]